MEREKGAATAPQQKQQLYDNSPNDTIISSSNVSKIASNISPRGGTESPVASTPKTIQGPAPSKLASSKPLSHRSQSSPSSLQTHKFGLRPTPSPPRLIIDHETGDIVESYPEQPVYLRTYQPLESNLQERSPAPNQPQQSLNRSDSIDDADDLDSSSLQATDMPSQQSNRPPVIPPPHSAANKVYFAPPEPSAGHLFNQQSPLGNYQRIGPPIVPPAESIDGAAGPSRSSLSGSHNSSFKRALNKLNESGKTDIAIVTEPDDYVPPERPDERFKVTATSASRANELLAKKKPAMVTTSMPPQPKASSSIKQSTGANNANLSSQSAATSKQLQLQQQTDSKYSPPAIEDFNLYGFCYNFRILLVVLLSSAIIYLLCSPPLTSDCSKFRPTQTYISIILASVNLICITIFTLFWYCNGVTRTLYANLSSSAFIITIYSILVALNLALGIIFFFINTCHFQKILNTQASNGADLALTMGDSGESESASLTRSAPNSDTGEEYDVPARLGTGWDRLRRLTSAGDDNELVYMLALKVDDSGPARHSKTKIKKRADDGNEQSDQTTAERQGRPQVAPEHPSDGDPGSSSGSGHQFAVHPPMQPQFAMSPLEVAWEYAKGQWFELKRCFRRFLIDYDLRFIGSLHALAAICLQYLAMKVAVVRSHYCSPVRAYV